MENENKEIRRKTYEFMDDIQDFSLGVSVSVTNIDNLRTYNRKLLTEADKEKLEHWKNELEEIEKEVEKWEKEQYEIINKTGINKTAHDILKALNSLSQEEFVKLTNAYCEKANMKEPVIIPNTKNEINKYFHKKQKDKTPWDILTTLVPEDGIYHPKERWVLVNPGLKTSDNPFELITNFNEMYDDILDDYIEGKLEPKVKKLVDEYMEKYNKE